MTLTANFADSTLRGCVGCVGEITTGRAHFEESEESTGAFLGAFVTLSDPFRAAQ